MLAWCTRDLGSLAGSSSCGLPWQSTQVAAWVFPPWQRLGVKAAVVGSLLVRVAGGAADFRGSGFVGGGGYIRVAVHAGEHAAMNGIFESLRIDVQADRLASDIVGEGGVTVASEAFLGSGFRLVFFAAPKRGPVARKEDERNPSAKPIPIECARPSSHLQVFRKLGAAVAASRPPYVLLTTSPGRGCSRPGP